MVERERGEGRVRNWGEAVATQGGSIPYVFAPEARLGCPPAEHPLVCPSPTCLLSPQSLSRCPVANRERLTIIPHGVPYMTKLLRYFVSEDSIFLHLEHVQGEGA